VNGGESLTVFQPWREISFEVLSAKPLLLLRSFDSFREGAMGSFLKPPILLGEGTIQPKPSIIPTPPSSTSSHAISSTL